MRKDDGEVRVRRREKENYGEEKRSEEIRHGL